MPFEFKPQDEGVTFFILIPFTTKEVEIRSEKEVDLSQESNVDEERVRLVVHRKANASWVETDSCVDMKLDLSRTGELQEEDELWLDFEDYMTSWDPAKKRVDTLATQIWQMTQSNATKTENLENDFGELSTKTRVFGWCGW